jgi:Transcription factor Iwr1
VCCRDNATENLYTDVYSCMTDLDYILGTNSDNDIGSEVEIHSEARVGNWSEDEDSNDEDNWRNDYPEDQSDDCTFSSQFLSSISFFLI